MFFQNLLNQSHDPEHFIDLINVWMKSPSNQDVSVAHKVDAFLEQLMDEQREPRSHIDDDRFFELLAMWMKQTDVEHRCAMMFNSEHMVGLSCISRNDDVDLLKSIPLYNVFAHNPNQSEVSLSFVSNLLTAVSKSEHTLHYIFSSSEFSAIVRGGEKCHINGKSMRVDHFAIESLLNRTLISNTTAGRNIAQTVKNVILDNLNTLSVHVVLDVLSTSHPATAITKDFLTDQRFLNWSDKDLCLVEYLLKANTILPAELISHFPPPLFEVSACHCAYLIIEGETFGKPTHLVFDKLHAVLQDHQDGVAVVRRTIEKLNEQSNPSLTVFPDRDIEMLLDCLSESQLQDWYANRWAKDEEFSIFQYPKFTKKIILDHIPNTTTFRKRVL